MKCVSKVLLAYAEYERRFTKFKFWVQVLLTSLQLSIIMNVMPFEMASSTPAQYVSPPTSLLTHSRSHWNNKHYHYFCVSDHFKYNFWRRVPNRYTYIITNDEAFKKSSVHTKHLDFSTSYKLVSILRKQSSLSSKMTRCFELLEALSICKKAVFFLK